MQIRFPFKPFRHKSEEIFGDERDTLAGRELFYEIRHIARLNNIDFENFEGEYHLYYSNGEWLLTSNIILNKNEHAETRTIKKSCRIVTKRTRGILRTSTKRRKRGQTGKRGNTI